MSPRAIAWILGVTLVAAALAVIVLAPPIAEPASLRALADGRRILGIANFWNVVSNAPLVLVGAWGMYIVSREKAAFAPRRDAWPYQICFLAVALSGVGSIYYHLAPSAERLMWDRLPIALGFMALLAAVIGERVSATAGTRSLAPLLIVGAASVFHWRWSDLNGAEDILPYAMVQYGAMGAVVALALTLPSRYARGGDVLIAIAIYAAAKVAEVLDAQVFAQGGHVSGHTLKHVLAALAVWWLVRMLQLRATQGGAGKSSRAASS